MPTQHEYAEYRKHICACQPDVGIDEFFTQFLARFIEHDARVFQLTISRAACVLFTKRLGDLCF